MTNLLLSEPAPTRRPALRLVRMVLGCVVLAAAVVTAGLFALGAWNPWQLVVLKTHFGNSGAGLGIAGAGAYLGTWLLAPVRNETNQRGRIAMRVLFAALAVGGFVVGGILGPQYRYDANQVAVTTDGDRRLVVALVGGLEERQLLVWDGGGLGAREVASLGRPCNRLTASFLSNDRIVVDQGHGKWLISLDPETGQPDHMLGARCFDPPVPVETLEP